MREYLQHFRENPAFESTFKLYKRILVPNIILSIILMVVSVIVVLPLVAAAFGIGITELADFNKEMQAKLISISKSGSDPLDFFKSFFGTINLAYVVLAIVLGSIISMWQYNLFYTLNDNEIRHFDNSFVNALKKSFNDKLIKLILLSLLLLLILIGVIIVFALLMGLMIAVSKGLGIFLMFIGIFVLCFYLIRLSLSYAALIHGDMGLLESIKFSYNKITFKRAVFIFLIMLVIAIISGIVSSIIILPISSALVNNSFAAFITTQIISSVISALLTAFFFSASSALYFRYSNDQVEDNESVKDHLVV